MILEFLNTNNEPITTVSTARDTVMLNLNINFEDTTAGSGRILKNDVVIGTFSRTAGSAVEIDMVSGNLARRVKHGDQFKLVLDTPFVQETTLDVVRTHFSENPKLGKLLDEVLRYEYAGSFPKILTQQEQQRILNLYGRKAQGFKHVSLFVKEILSGLDDQYDISISTIPMVDSFQCAASVQKIISTSEILNNDLVRVNGSFVPNQNADILEIVSVKSVVGGVVTTSTFNGKISSIKFTDNIGVGGSGSFVCEIKNKQTSEIFESTVNLFVKERHPITAVADVYNLTQNGTLTLTTTQLVSNDVTINAPITFLGLVGTPVGGTVSLSGTTITFVSTGFAGEPASFQYQIRDSKGNTSVGTVNINILELPEIEVYIFPTEELELFKNSYTPPSLTEIFNTWDRFSNNTLYYPAGTTPGGEAASWQLYGSGFRCTVNSSYLTGFVSPKEFTNYVHECTLSSVAEDNDVIALVVAFKRIGSSNYAILAVREPGGLVAWTNSTSWSLLLFVDGTVTVLASISNTSFKKSGNWSVVKYTRVRVERIGSMISATCSQFGTTAQLAVSKLEIDLNDFPSLAWALEPCKYGYSCLSQQYSTFSAVTFEGGANANQLFDLTLNCTWDYVTGAWVQDTEKTIQSVVGYPRTVTNPVNGKKYRIEATTITEIV